MNNLRAIAAIVCILITSVHGAEKSRRLSDFILGLNCHQFYSENTPLLRDLGLSSSRLDIVWRDISDSEGKILPDSPILKRTLLAPLSLSNTLGILCYGHPRFQNGGRPTEISSRQAFVSFCRETVSLLKPHVRFFEIWNEWDVISMGDTPKEEGHGNPEDYVKLLADSYKTIKKSIPEVTVLGGATAGIGDREAYFQRILKAGLLDFCDGIVIHPYFYGEKDPVKRLPEIALPARLKKVEQWLSPYPSEKRKPLYVTEMGWPTLNTPEGVTHEQQANWLARSVLILALYQDVKGVWIYELRDGKNDPNDREANFGLVRWDGKPKPSYDCFRDLVRLLSENETIAKVKLGNDNVAAVKLRNSQGRYTLAIWSIFPSTTFLIRLVQSSGRYAPKTIGRIQYPDGPVPVDPEGWFSVGERPVLITVLEPDFQIHIKKK